MQNIGFIVVSVIVCPRSWLGSLWGDLVEVFSDSSSQSPSFTTTSTDPRKLSTMLEAIETNLSDMFKVKRVEKVWKQGLVAGRGGWKLVISDARGSN